MDTATHNDAGSTLLCDELAAELLDIAPGTLAVWRSTRRYQIPFVKVGRNVRYRREDLLAWIESRTHLRVA
jgi:excisionase family DNA binding protein